MTRKHLSFRSYSLATAGFNFTPHFNVETAVRGRKRNRWLTRNFKDIMNVSLV